MRETGAAQRRIKDAMLQLIREKPFEKITISEVIRLAHVSRTTYYYHYYEQTEVVDEIISDFYRDLQAVFDDERTRPTPSYETLFPRCIHVFLEHGEALRTILASSLSEHLERSFFSLWIQYGLQWEESFQDYYASAEKADHLTGSFVFSGIWGLLREWVLSGCEEPEDKVSDLLKRLCLAAMLD